MGRLGVNIDHVATLRNQRDEGYPNLKRAAELCLESGAEQITIHLREDRRHIRDSDLAEVKSVTDKFDRLLNLEVGTNLEIAKIAGELKPNWVCIVPEKREEKTTEGGIDICQQSVFSKVLEVAKLVNNLSHQTKISLFIEGSEEVFQAVLKMNKEIKVDAVEIHTGDYARHVLEGKDIRQYLDKYLALKDKYKAAGIGFHAGHGLTRDSLRPLCEENIFEEYNIGHWIIAESIFEGLPVVLNNLQKMLKQ